MRRIRLSAPVCRRDKASVSDPKLLLERNKLLFCAIGLACFLLFEDSAFTQPARTFLSVHGNLRQAYPGRYGGV
ncbi:hypothetical protein PF66_03731 [Pseudomonas asplenii]|uniref:Uncharacterized protein n=1 Tax=Pseudomonas asplenii TaxID=53407 RepID=A0A0N0E3C0_9PSED|nr:hypothetical protein PF66_03731 [Pseudomonas fuscovaginae]